jgi:hypothetical protein
MWELGEVSEYGNVTLLHIYLYGIFQQQTKGVKMKELAEVISFTDEKNLEDYFRQNLEKGIIDFSLRASETVHGIQFYIHPTDKDGETMDFVVDKNTLGVYKGVIEIDEADPRHSKNLK